MTKVTIDRELLERLAAPLPGDNGWQTWHTQEMIEASKELRVLLDAPRQPEGDGLEVVAWNITVKMDGRTWSEYTEKLPFLPDAKVTWHSEPEPVCRLSDAQRAIAKLTDRNTKLCATINRMVAEGVLICDERDTLRQQLAEANDDTNRWHEIACKQSKRADGLAARRDKLAGLLREVRGYYKAMPTGMGGRIDAALAEVNK